MAQEKISAQISNAWLLDFGQSVRAAVGKRVLLQMIDQPKLLEVPCTPPYCHSVFSWQGRLLPVMDMAARLTGVAQTPKYLVVVGFQEQPDEPVCFGALLLSAAPAVIAVTDTQSCPLPEQPADWNKYACSCFEYQSEAVPVLHLSRIFFRP